MRICSGNRLFATSWEEDWANDWKKYYKAIYISDKILVSPSWEKMLNLKMDKSYLNLIPVQLLGREVTRLPSLFASYW